MLSPSEFEINNKKNLKKKTITERSTFASYYVSYWKLDSDGKLITSPT
jgi:hypothetical protein